MIPRRKTVAAEGAVAEPWSSAAGSDVTQCIDYCWLQAFPRHACVLMCLDEYAFVLHAQRPHTGLHRIHPV